MTTRRSFMASAGFGLGAAAVGAAFLGRGQGAVAAPTAGFPLQLTDEQWRKRLTSVQYQILRHEGTEPPFSSPLNDEHRTGVFSCAGCGQKAYLSNTKFDSGTGWPSFYEPIANAVAERPDTSLGMMRTEVHCANCGGHLGHVFDDGPRPTGLRYCMNGAAMQFQAT